MPDPDEEPLLLDPELLPSTLPDEELDDPPVTEPDEELLLELAEFPPSSPEPDPESELPCPPGPPSPPEDSMAPPHANPSMAATARIGAAECRAREAISVELNPVTVVMPAAAVRLTSAPARPS